MTTSSIPGANVSSRPGPQESPAQSERSAAARSGSDELLDHAYDGIREYDNPLPRWWVWAFWASFVFAIGYFFHFHISHNGVSVHDAYEADVAEARAISAKRALAEPVTEDSLGKLLNNPAATAEGGIIFQTRCTPCHGDHAQGIIGPNLTDNAWIHGKGTLSDIYAVVNEGVLDKGMPAWGKQLAPAEVRKVVAFVGTQRGKNAAGKSAEGTVVE
ncbi:MAG TPA: cbb3-type cytochrome c oxidase N-terminal domain-containing protein [Polyangiaceae bacterium]|jgi:cytochrome c oxidase cbb3-type subunit 3